MDDAVVLFSARSVEERRKGATVLRDLLARMAVRRRGQRRVTLALLGADGGRWQATDGIQIHPLGYLQEETRVAAAYAAADVLLLPTRADNLPNVLIEALACGTPAVTFDVGGCAEVVRHLETGYVARPGDMDDFARGAWRLLDDSALHARMAQRGREVAEQEHTLDLQAARYCALYERLVAAWRERTPEPPGRRMVA
jgi:glycosyltransferase involved in cell wall biosynthesis